jgi:quercetin dioxygenase-like cupin family protein
MPRNARIPLRLPIVLTCLMTAPAFAAEPASIAPAPGPGSNEMLRAPVTVADGLEVIISDVVIPPNGAVPRHYHPGEEFLYVIQGSAIHVEEGQPDRVLRAGDSYVIPPEAVHAPRGGPEGARAIVFRVHVAGQPERIPVPEESE